jgi:hypothetical protein
VCDGLRLSSVALQVFVRYYLLPLVFVVLLVMGARGVADAVGDYVGHGGAGPIGQLFVGLAILAGSLTALVALQTDTPLGATARAVFRGIIGPAVGAVLFFILLSVGLALGRGLLPDSPYTVGPLTIAAFALVVGGFGLQFAFAQRGVEQAPAATPTRPSGTEVRFGLTIGLCAALALTMGLLTLWAGTGLSALVH